MRILVKSRNLVKAFELLAKPDKTPAEKKQILFALRYGQGPETVEEATLRILKQKQTMADYLQTLGLEDEA